MFLLLFVFLVFSLYFCVVDVLPILTRKMYQLFRLRMLIVCERKLDL